MAIQATHKENTFGVGDVVRVHQILTDKSKEEKGSRTQVFEGTVMDINGKDVGKTFTVRRIGAQNVGIEMIFPISSPLVEKVEVVREGVRGVRRAKLYYTRDKSKKEIETIYTRAKRRELRGQKPVEVKKQASKQGTKAKPKSSLAKTSKKSK